MDDLKMPGPIATALQHLGAVGGEHAITSRELMRYTGFRDIRTFRKAVEQERQHSIILANSRGLFLPDAGEKGRHEISIWTATVKARIAGAARTLREARGALRIVEGQQHIEDVGERDVET